jgi:hypothetical protein
MNNFGFRTNVSIFKDDRTAPRTYVRGTPPFSITRRTSPIGNDIIGGILLGFAGDLPRFWESSPRFAGVGSCFFLLPECSLASAFTLPDDGRKILGALWLP